MAGDAPKSASAARSGLASWRGGRGDAELSRLPFRALPAVEATSAEALSEGVHSTGIILNILARQREPGPPVMIMTLQGLRLRHEPGWLRRCDGRRRAI